MTVKNAMNLFRDVQVAEEFHQMAAEGYIDTEFTMYATTWLDGGERHYLLSADEARVIDFLDGAVRAGIAPLPIRSLTETCPVPLGEKENIARNVKLELARSLQQDYPLEFFQLLWNFSSSLRVLPRRMATTLQCRFSKNGAKKLSIAFQKSS